MLAKEDFDQIYSDFFADLMRISYRITFDTEASEDICQDAFIKLYHRLYLFPTCQDAKYWLIRVVKNLSINCFKRRKNEAKAIEKVKREPLASHKTGEELLLQSEAHSLVKEALAKLPPKLKDVLVLREYSGLNYKEIAKALSISESNVKVRAFRARAMLLSIMTKMEEENVSK